MDLLAQLSAWITRAMDLPCGWLLLLPRDVAIVALAAGTSLILTLARKWTTPQDRLYRCRNDVRRLRQLLREAKAARDKAAVRRHRQNLATVKLIRATAEGKPLLASILPIALLAVWAVERLDYLPPAVGQPLTVRAYYPMGSVGRRTHLVAPDGVEVETGAIRLVEVDPDGEANGLASWIVRPTRALDGAELLIRHRGDAARHPPRAGGWTYAAPLVGHTGGHILATQVVLVRAKFLGVVPGLVGLPPWLIGYLIVVIPLVPLLRRALRVY